ncbi:acyl carrier protein KNAG_0B06520 [Huiozyma naganishii CBS 8797]|uniref:Acyl carrier protein n=1 Tax=Huiozyma naganishii (strain ATCC MYA-139 / BCRC 22969 / CBS 8797 / KCTC 17520 / NBRC 10181 / NCYC 3082 / Yp74L-3) TaxID=1071383 RepID=J7R2N6_HUIN7|nr:hypothetical protein KNAG_0B06520 [Kazachstania naganishii CBS 8797]CCK69080.1 hypothetical protein KNAG_0B06520 [Kazachstania naganishii CBS 8797]
MLCSVGSRCGAGQGALLQSRQSGASAFVSKRFFAAAAGGNTLKQEDVLKRVGDVIKSFSKTGTSASNADTPAAEVTEATSFQKDLGLDSLDTVELLVAIEEEFEIEIPDKVADELKTVGETVKHILSNPEAN